MTEQMNLQAEKESIEFTKTSAPFISAGISGLIKYCDKRINYKDDIRYEINGNTLKIEAENLNTVLQEMYLEMGEEYYNTSNKTSLSDKDSFYYDDQNNKVVQSKYKTFGYSYLLNNSKQRKIGEKVEFDKLTDAAKGSLKDYYKENNLNHENHKMINVNGRFTTVPKHEEMQIIEGKRKCIVCGYSYTKTWESKSISPFLKGISGGNNFVSKMKGAEKVCWKCVYLLRFSPVYAFYQYAGENINSYFFNSDTIEGLRKINNVILDSVFMLPDQLLEKKYLKNFSFYKFGHEEDKDYFNYPAEQLLMLLYTVYQQMEIAKPRIVEENEWIEFKETLQYKTEVFYLKAKSFGSTLRPVKAETYTDLHYLFSVFQTIEEENINLQHLLWSLKLQEGDNRTVLRNKWADQFLHRIPTIKTCEEIVWTNFMSKKYNRDFKQILKWLKNYEPIINYGGNKHMDDKTRELAINLGKQLGHYNPKTEENPKTRKSKLIKLRKAKNLKQFNEVIVSFLLRYTDLKISKDYVKKISELNFDYFRQFTLISALNQFNTIQQPKTQESNNEN